MENLPAKSSRQRRMRDRRAQRAAKRLAENPVFAQVPGLVLSSFTALACLASEVRAKLAQRGLIRPDGTFDPGIDIYRRLKDSEARYLAMMLAVGEKDGRKPKPVLDLDDIRDDE